MPAAVRWLRGARPGFVAGAAVFLLSWVAYVANCRGVYTVDSLGTALAPFAIWNGEGLVLDRFVGEDFPGDLYCFYRDLDGRWRNTFPIGASLVAAPLYAPLLIEPELDPATPDRYLPLVRVLEKYAAATICALSVLLLFGLLQPRIGNARAGLLAGAFGLGTPMWSGAGQGRREKGPATLVLLSGLHLLLAARVSGTRAALCGALSALLVAIRPADAFFAGALFLVAWRRGRRSAALPFAATAILFGLLLIRYNLTTAGSAMGGYSRFWGEATYSFSLSALPGLLLSHRGLLVCSPFLLVLLIPFRRPGWLDRFEVAVLSAAWLATLLLYCGFYGWWGGQNYGARYLIDGLPILFVLGSGALEHRIGPARTVLGSLALVGAVALQAVGAFCFPMGESGHASESESTFWSLRRSPQLLALDAGLAPFELRPLSSLGPLQGLEPEGRRAEVALLTPLAGDWSAGELRNVRVELRNAGNASWSAAAGPRGEHAVGLLSLWRAPTGEILRGSTYSLRGAWAPGERRRISVAVLGPESEGDYTWQLVVAQRRLESPLFFDGPTASIERPVTIRGRASTIWDVLAGRVDGDISADDFESGDAARWSLAAGMGSRSDAE